MNKRDTARVAIEGTSYALQVHKIDKGIKPTGEETILTFVRGPRDGDQGAEGVMHESLLVAMIADLKHKSTIVPSRETALAITNLEQALHWMEEREYQREQKGVSGTDKPHDAPVEVPTETKPESALEVFKRNAEAYISKAIPQMSLTYESHEMNSKELTLVFYDAYKRERATVRMPYALALSDYVTVGRTVNRGVVPISEQHERSRLIGDADKLQS